MRKIWVLVLILVVALLCAGCSSPEMTNTKEPMLDKQGKVIMLPDGTPATRTIITKKESNWPLSGKIVNAHQNAFFLKIETTGSAQTGSAMPNVDLAVGDNQMGTMPAIDFRDQVVTINVPAAKSYANSHEYLHIQKSAWPWVSEFSIIDYDYQSAGVGAPKPIVKINIDAASGTNSASAKAAPAGLSQEDIDNATEVAKDWLSKEENQNLLKSWASKAWSWMSSQFK